MAYATGKFSYGLCDYCGQRYDYNVLRKNWRGFKVCPDDYEPKAPQLEPLKYKGDAIALYEPRPDRIEPVSVFVGAPGFTLVLLHFKALEQLETPTTCVHTFKTRP